MLSTENEPALGKFLLDRGMASLIRESDVECDSSGRPLLAGLLGVPHRNGLRMIFDRRPENCGDARLHWAHLPLGAQFTRAVIKPGWTIRGSGEDLKTCFPQCLKAPAALSRSAFGRRFDGPGFEEFGGKPGSAYCLALRVIAMGDQIAVDVAQALHVDLSSAAGTVTDSGLIRYRHAVPASGVLEGVYIEDLIVAIIARDRELNSAKREDKDLISNAPKAYQTSGLIRSPDKAFGWCAGEEGCPAFAAWGTHIDGGSGRVGSPPAKRLILAGPFMHVPNMRMVPVSIMVSLLALTVHPSMHRRELAASAPRVQVHL